MSYCCSVIAPHQMSVYLQLINRPPIVSITCYIRMCIYVCMYLGQWDVSLDPIKQAVLAEMYIMQSNVIHNCSVE